MQRNLFFAFVLLLTSAAAYGQATTAVTATITDPSGHPYVNCSWDMHTSAIPQSYNGRCNTTGTLTQTVTSGVSWVIHFCDFTGHTCGQATQTVTGATADLSAALSAAAPTLVGGPPQVIEGSGESPLVLTSPSGTNKLSFNLPDSGNPSIISSTGTIIWANLFVTNLAGHGNRCLQTDNAGNVTVAPGACGTGGGGANFPSITDNNPNGITIAPGPLMVGSSTPLAVLAGTSGGVGGTCSSPAPTPTANEWGMSCNVAGNLQLSTGLNVGGDVNALHFTVNPLPITPIGAAPLGQTPTPRRPATEPAMRIYSRDHSHFLDLDVPDVGDPHFASSTGHIAIENDVGQPGTIGGGGGGPGGGPVSISALTDATGSHTIGMNGHWELSWPVVSAHAFVVGEHNGTSADTGTLVLFETGGSSHTELMHVVQGGGSGFTVDYSGNLRMLNGAEFWGPLHSNEIFLSNLPNASSLATDSNGHIIAGTGGGGPGGPVSFTDLQAGTNTGALVIGAGGSLTTAGTGAIRANALRSGTNDRTIPAFATGYLYHSGTTLSWNNSIPFNILGTGTNSSATMTVSGSGQVVWTGTGIIDANHVNGEPLPPNAPTLATNAAGQIIAGSGGAGLMPELGDFTGILLGPIQQPERIAIFGNLYTRHSFIGPDPHNPLVPAPDDTKGGSVVFGSSGMTGEHDHLASGDVYLSSGDNEASGETESTGALTIRPGLVRNNAVTSPENGALHVEMTGTISGTYAGGTLACTSTSAAASIAGPGFTTCTTANAEAGKWVGIFAEPTTAMGSTGHSVSVATVGNAYFRSYTAASWTVGNAICSDGTYAGYLVALTTCVSPRVTVGVVAYSDPVPSLIHYGIILSHHIQAAADNLRGVAIPTLTSGFLRYTGSALAWSPLSLSDIGPSYNNHTIESRDNYNEIASAFTDNGGGISWLLWDSSVDTNSSGQQLYIWNQGNNNVIPLDVSLAGGGGLYVEDHSGDLVMQGTSGIRSPFLAGSCGTDTFTSEVGQWGMACSTTNITEEFIGWLREAMTATSTTVQLADAAHPSVHNGDLLLIDYEAMTVTNASDQENLVVARGSNGTTAAAHLADKFVRLKVAATNHLMFTADGRESQELGAGADFKGKFIEHMAKIHGAIFGNHFDRPAYFGPDPEHTPVTDPGTNARGAPVGLLSAPMAGADSGMRTGDVFIQTGENEGSGTTEGTGRIVIRPGLIAGHDVTSPQSGTLEIAIAGSIANPDAFPGGMLACVAASGGNVNFPAPQYAACSVADAEEGKYIGVFSEHLVTTGANSKGVSVSVVGNAYFTSYSSTTWTAGQAICIDHDHDGYLISSLHCSSRELMVGIVGFTDTSSSRQHRGILLSHH